MFQIALTWQWEKGISSPIIGVTKKEYIDDAVNAINIKLTKSDIKYLEELYIPHPIVGAIDRNPEKNVVLLDEQK